jgi:hypothetical protein
MPPCALTDRLDAFLDGDLAPAETTAFEAHLAGCAACADEVVLARRLHAGLRALPPAPCPDDVFEGALARIAALERDRPAMPMAARRTPRWRTLGVGAALLALLALTLLLARTPTEAPDAPAIASNPPTELPPPPVPAPPVEATPEEPAAPAPQAAPEPRPARRIRRAAPSAVETPDAPQVVVAAPDSSALSPEAEAARDGALLALALVADAHREAEEALRADVGDGLGAVSDALDFAFPR